MRKGFIKSGRVAAVAGLLAVMAGCVQTGDVQPMRTGEGREQAKQAYIQLGKGYLQEGLTSQAKAPLQSALELDPSDPEAHEVMALVFQQERQPALADKHFHKAMDIYKDAAEDSMYPRRARVFENMGLTALKLDDKTSAGHYFQRALRLDSSQRRSLLEMATLSYEARDYTGARQYYE